MEAVGRRELAEAIMLLEEGVQANPFWLRGYLFLATIYEYAQNAELAITTIKQGLAMCACGLRLFSAQRRAETPERINGPVAHRRMWNHVERLRQYERMFRIDWRCCRSTAAGLMKRLNNGPPSKRCIAPKEG